MADTNLLILAREFKNLRTHVQEVLKMPVGPQGLQGEKGEQGVKGEVGSPGKNGKDGKDGVNGLNGSNGTNGVDGQDGNDGLDGVGVANAYIDFDNSLVIVLTSGQEINAGFLSQEAKDSVVATFKQGASTINELLPVQTGNTGKVLTTDGTNTYWSTPSGGGGGAVTSVNGQTGVVVLTAASVGAEPANTTILKSADIGVTVQAYDVDLTAWANVATTAKQNTLVSGTSIKTVNSTSLLGSGDVAVQPTLVSGTNIKTINGNTLLGSGDLTISGGGGGASALTISNKIAAYTVVAGDLGTIINCTSGTFTISLTAAATLGAGFNVTIWNTSDTNTHAITIDPSGAETIDGKTQVIVRRGEGLQIICTGTNWETGNKKTMRGYAENFSIFQSYPVATGPGAVAIGNSSEATFAATVGIFGKANSEASSAIGYNSGYGLAQTSIGTAAMALGGSYASGTDSFAAAISNNTSTYGAQGANSIAIGCLSKATGTRSIAISGNSAVSSNTEAIAIGSNALASGSYCLALGEGQSTATAALAIGYSYNTRPTASKPYSIAFGGDSVAAEIGKIAFATGYSFSGTTVQTGIFILRRATTNATASVLTTTSGVGAVDNQVILPNNSAYAFSGTVVAKQSGSTNAAAWKVEGLIVRGTTAASTTLVSSTVTAISNLPLWTLALSADTTNGGLAVTSTGAATTNIRWVGTIQTSEVTYA